MGFLSKRVVSELLSCCYVSCVKLSDQERICSVNDYTWELIQSWQHEVREQPEGVPAREADEGREDDEGHEGHI